MSNRNVTKKEPEEYDERTVMDDIVAQGKPAIIAHLKLLKERNEFGYLKEAMDYLVTKGVRIRPIDLMDSSS